MWNNSIALQCVPCNVGWSKKGTYWTHSILTLERKNFENRPQRVLVVYWFLCDGHILVKIGSWKVHRVMRRTCVTKKNRLCRRRPNDNFASTGPIAPKFTERCCPYDARLPNSVRIGWALPNLFAKDCRFRNPKSITIEADRCVLFRLQWHGAARSIYATAELLVSQACIVIVVIHRYDNISHKL